MPSTWWGWGGSGRDAYVTTHLLVALDKAGGGGEGGRKRRANRYYYNSEEPGGGPCCSPPQTAPALMRSCRRRCQHADGVCGKVIHLHRIPGWTGGLGKSQDGRTDGRHSAPPTATHGDMLQQLRQRRAARTVQSGAEHIGSVKESASCVHLSCRMCRKRRTRRELTLQVNVDRRLRSNVPMFSASAALQVSFLIFQDEIAS